MRTCSGLAVGPEGLGPNAEICGSFGIPQCLDSEALHLVVGVCDMSLHVVDVALRGSCANEPSCEILP